MKKIILITILIAYSLLLNAQTAIYSENFESVTIPFLPANIATFGLSGSDKFKSGDNISCKSNNFNLPPHSKFAYTNDDTCDCNKSSDELHLPILDFSGYTNVTLNLDYFMNSDLSTTYLDSGYIYITDAGWGTATVIHRFSKTSSWQSKSISLAAYDNKPNIKIAILYSDLTNWGYGMALDNISITGNSNSNQTLNYLPIAGGGNSSFAICNNGTLKSWGANIWGQLGDGTTIDRRDGPVNTLNVTNIKEVSSSGHHTLGLKSDGTVYAWGRNTSGQLGIGSSINHLTIASTIPSINNAIKVSAGGNHSLILKNDGTVWAFGSNNFGELGNGTLIASTTPILINSLSNIISISCGTDYALALKNDGTVWAWGRNYFGKLGDGTVTDRSLPVQVTNLNGIIEISAGEGHALALKNDGTVWAWGANCDGEIGDGTGINPTCSCPNTGVSNSCKKNPVLLTLSDIIHIKAGDDHSLAVKNDGTVWAWGANFWGELGDGSNIPKNSPIQVSSLAGITAVDAGSGHSLFLKNDGSVFACGYNTYGQLSNGDIITHTSINIPEQVVGLCQLQIGIKEFINILHSLKIFPTVNSGHFNVAANGLEIKNNKSEILDSFGKIVKEVQINDEGVINCQELNSGLYFLKVYIKDQIIASKFIIQK